MSPDEHIDPFVRYEGIVKARRRFFAKFFFWISTFLFWGALATFGRGLWKEDWQFVVGGLMQMLVAIYAFLVGKLNAEKADGR